MSAEDKVKELAKMLLKQGLSNSMCDAMEKAKNIMGDEIIKEEQNFRIDDAGSGLDELNTLNDKCATETPVQSGPMQFKAESSDEISPSPEDMLGTYNSGQHESSANNDAARLGKPDYEISSEESSLSALLMEIGVDPEEVKQKEKQRLMEEAREIKHEIEVAEKNSSINEVGSIKDKLKHFEEELDEFERKV